MSWSTF